MQLTKTASAILGMALGQLIPDVSDVLHFAVFLPYLSNPLNQANRILYVLTSLMDWYLAPFLWFIFVFAIVVKYGKSGRNEILLAVGLLSAGAVIGVLGKFLLTGTFF